MAIVSKSIRMQMIEKDVLPSTPFGGRSLNVYPTGDQVCQLPAISNVDDDCHFITAGNSWKLYDHLQMAAGIIFSIYAEYK